MNEELKDVAAILEQVREHIITARPVPLSASVMVNPNAVVYLIEDVIESLPEEFKRARWIMKERDELLDRARRDADRIMSEALEEANHVVSQQEIVKKAARTAQELLDDAKDGARTKILQAEDYVDQKLSQFEASLLKTLETIDAARVKLRRGAEVDADLAEEYFGEEEGEEFDDFSPDSRHAQDAVGPFFDQDVP